MNIEREHLNLVHLCFHAVSSMVSLQWYGCPYGDDLARHTQSCFWAFLLLVPDITSALAASSKFRAATPFQHFTQTYVKMFSSLTCSHTRTHKVETLEILWGPQLFRVSCTLMPFTPASSAVACHVHFERLLGLSA